MQRKLSLLILINKNSNNQRLGRIYQLVWDLEFYFYIRAVCKGYHFNINLLLACSDHSKKCSITVKQNMNCDWKKHQAKTSYKANIFVASAARIFQIGSLVLMNIFIQPFTISCIVNNTHSFCEGQQQEQQSGLFWFFKTPLFLKCAGHLNNFEKQVRS